jgi:YD repeat-containing protein
MKPMIVLKIQNLKSADDRCGQRILSESDGFATQYTYTPNRLVESIIQGDQSVQYSYDVAGQRISAKTPEVTTIYNYDGAGRLVKMDHQNIAHYDYQWVCLFRNCSRSIK